MTIAMRKPGGRKTDLDMAAAVGFRIRCRRDEAGLTLQQLGEAAGVSLMSVWYIESGRNFPSPPTMVAICRALGCSPNDLFGWSEEAI